MSLAAGMRLGPYEMVSLVSDAAGGAVYLARDARLGRDVAIKILRPGLADTPMRRAQFERTAREIAQLNHPNICGIYDVGEQDGVLFLVMEHVRGESLDARLRSGWLSWRTALTIAVQIAGALDAAHKRGILHRGLEPANVVLVGSSVKLIDFGIAALAEPAEVGDTPAGANLTAEHQIGGTLNYMAPEQLEGRELDARTDIFALGAVLYEMLTGRKAFDGESAASVTTAVMTVTPAPISETVKGDTSLPPALNHIVQRALAKRREDRWQTARDLGHELRWLLDSTARTAAASAASGRLRRFARLALAATLLLAVATIIGRFARLATTTPPQPPRMVTFTINAPEGTQLDSADDMLAVSPDGKAIAFVASENGKSSLWRKDLNTLDPRQIPDTEGAQGPFWSPDSQSIGFFVDRGTRIKRVKVLGGRADLITEVRALGPLAQGTTACWMPDDTIIYSSGPGLFRVPASGGDIKLVAAIGAARGEERISAPSTLEAGSFFYLVGHKDPTHEYEGRIGSLVGQPKSLPSIQSNAFLASGNLIFRQDDALVAQKIDERTFALVGNPVVLVPHVDYDPATARAAFSASPTVLAYRQEAARQLTWIDRYGLRLGPIGDQQDRNPVIARDGSGTVAVDHFSGTGAVQIRAFNAQGPAALVSARPVESAPVWSPDGKSLAYRRGPPRSSALYRAQILEGAKEELLLQVAGAAEPLDWWRDNQHDQEFLLYNLDSDLWVYSFDTKKSRRLTTLGTVEKSARLSPDGQWVAYSIREGGGISSLWVRAFPDGQPMRVDTEGGFDPSWRGDSRELYYMTNAGRLMAASVGGSALPVVGAPAGLFAIDPSGIRNPVHVFAATADGQRFLVSEPARREAAITVIVNWPALLR